MKKDYIICLLIIIIFLSIFIFQKINLTTADIGRHLMNGKVLLNSGLNLSKDSLLYTNFYSYTYPNYPFINHHWFSGILFFSIFSIFGFDGLSLIYGLIIILSVIILIKPLKNKVEAFIFLPIVLFLIPLITNRTEIRPEGFSYLFTSIIISLLILYNKDEINKKYLFAIPFILSIWVNSHIYFIFGLFIIGLFLFENLLKKDFEKTKFLSLILGLSFLTTLLNPYGLNGIIYPLKMFNNYGYLIVENQSIHFLEKLHIEKPIFFWWKISSLFFIIYSALIFSKKKKEFPIALFILSTTFMFFSYFAIRNMTMFGLVLIPTIIYYTHLYFENKKIKRLKIYSIVISLLIVMAMLINFKNQLPWWKYNWGVGLEQGVNSSADFFKDLKISGPIFSNYDIGGYLIFHLYPTEKVFVDNRPEVYPESFFKDEYIPMQEDNKKWKEQLNRWKFNVIWFYRMDITPWAQQFLIDRIKDTEWVPIFIDDYTIIFIKKNEENKEIIQKYKIPQEVFRII